MKPVIITEERVTSHTYNDLRNDIRAVELNLFAMKRRLAGMQRPTHDTVLMQAPYPFRCATCFNHKCLNFQLIGVRRTLEGAVIANQTTMNGCLEWLPERP